MVYNKKTRKTLISVTSVIMTGALAFSVALPLFNGIKAHEVAEGETPGITRMDNVKSDLSKYYDTSVVQPLPEAAQSGEISVIINMDKTGVKSVLDSYNETKSVTSAKTVGEYINTRDGRNASVKIAKERAKLISRLDGSGVDYELGNSFEVLFGGFEITINSSDFEKVYEAIGTKATLIVGEEYEKCETQVVENNVNVHDTGIFNSEGLGFDGSGTVVAVLDTGLDYTHTAFDASRFKGEEVISLSNIDLSGTRAAAFSAGLKAEDVYVSAKVPFAYDYADKDADVYPIASEHGTHVAGVIGGKDDTITGVAINAQLAIFKVFSDTAQGAKQSWILAALEDCVTLGVDVINMSLGSSCGFAREEDKEETSNIYNKIGENGISLVVAASNDYNSTFGSEKNGNLGLTSNPDSATVGSPSTYESALSVASISGVKRSYLKYGETIMYFTESTGRGAKKKDFVNDILGSENERDFEYVTVPGVGRTADYSGLDVSGKIALIQRGQNSFEEKARIAKNKGAIGAIIYNNVSGDISMTVGGVGDFPVCSISQDNGKVLASSDSGKIKISKDQKAGPFMSDFSSWGPTPSLGIKPEITAHGGEILSAVPGQSYDRLSGTSMASPNQAGVTALIRQYVKMTFPTLNAKEVTARVNQIMMSTTDIAHNMNGLPSAVRKQGAGLANLTKATTSKAYITTFKNGEVMDKAKLELGDDPSKTGVYTMKFAVNNFGPSALTYDVSAIVMTEGVSSTLTDRGDTTVTEEGYALSPSVTVTKVTNGVQNGNSVTVDGGKNAEVTLQVVLSDADKQYLDEKFSNGMYIEGFVMLKAQNGIDLNVPFLAFYGDWTKAPMFDLDYFETNKDEIDDGLNAIDKTLPDAYATRALGGTYSDYITYLGAYNYLQAPGSTKIAADRKYISLSNQNTGDSNSTIHSIYGVYAGMLRGAKLIVATITDSVTGEVIFEKEIWNQKKSYNYGSAIGPSSLDLDFSVADYNLKNNTKYIVKLQGYLDYNFDREDYETAKKAGVEYNGGGLESNLRNTFEFPFVTDFQAPSITDCRFRSEYDNSMKKNRLYAEIDIYDNHYSSAAIVGYIGNNPDYTPNGSEPRYTMDSFDRYLTTLYSDFNSTYTMTYELTDYLEEIKTKSYNNRTFIVDVLDYAQNEAIYEIEIPDSVLGVNFADKDGNPITELTLSPNEIYQPNTVVTPSDLWAESVNYSVQGDAVRIVNGKIFAAKPGTAIVTATANGNSSVSAQLTVTVLKAGDPGYVSYDKPVADSFKLTEYYVNKVFYFSSNDERGLNATTAGQTVKFTGNSYNLSMYPSESVTVKYAIDAYFPEDVTVEFRSGNSNIVTVDEKGKITAVNEGNASVSVNVYLDGKSTYYSQNISINVKNPYNTNTLYLLRYTGNGGVVEIPSDLGVTEIYQYAFCGYHSVPKDENDEISDEDPYNTKFAALGDDTITKIIIPEGVETIQLSAFQNLTALEEVVLPSTLKKIESEAFSGCKKLKKINLENVQFINMEAFKDCPLEEVNLAKIVAIGNDAFNNSALISLDLPKTAQSLGSGAFADNKQLASVTINADKVKLGSGAFSGCLALNTISINASVIPESAFDGCSALTDVTLGDDVTSIGAFAFAGTQVSKFKLANARRSNFTAQTLPGTDYNYLTLKSNSEVLVLVSPLVTEFMPIGSNIKEIGEGAFSGNTSLTMVGLSSVTVVNDYAFAGCTSLDSAKLQLGNITVIGNYAFFQCEKLLSAPYISGVDQIGEYAFAFSGISTVNISNETTVGAYAFAACVNLTEVTVGSNSIIGDFAFMMPVTDGQLLKALNDGTYDYYIYVYLSPSKLTDVTVGDNVVIGTGAFQYNMELSALTLGNGVEIGAYAFFNDIKLTAVDLSKVTYVGAFAFSGETIPVLIDAGGKGNQSDFVYVGDSGAYTTNLSEVDLSSAKEIGAGAFAYMTSSGIFNFETSLTKVILGNDLKVIPEGAFYGCNELKEINLGNVTQIGASAFGGSGFTELDLSSVEILGQLAFRGSEKLVKVTLKEGVIVSAGAFMASESLAEAVNLDKVSMFGDYAFAGTALTKADLRGATYIGSNAFSSTAVTEVVLGDNLTYVGDNPFAGCQIGEFADFNDDKNSPVKVIDGVLYCVAPNGGLVLVTYPMLKDDKTFAVAEGTVRLSAMAFMGAPLKTVELPQTLKAIGDKAFYGCQNLGVIVFKSLEAPILEEEYDESYYNAGTNYPFTGTVQTGGGKVNGLGIVPYYMWNPSSVAMFYGANFVNYIGKVENPLLMVRPTNGTGYGTFIMEQYFDTVIDGAAAANQQTLDVIAAINALPSKITLADEAAVIAARALYDAITSHEQLALVTNYDTLTAAESTIRFLKGDSGEIVIPPEENEKPVDNSQAIIITLAVLTGVFGAAAIALTVWIFLPQLKKLFKKKQ